MTQADGVPGRKEGESYLQYKNRIIQGDNIKSSLLQERGKTHGDSVKQFNIAQNLKRVIRNSPSSYELTSHETEALEMMCVKISRILCGDPHFADHWFDAAGYATLVAEDLAKRPTK